MQRSDIDRTEADVRALRLELQAAVEQVGLQISEALERQNKRLASMEREQAVQGTVLRNNSDLMNRFIGVGFAVAIAVLGSAAAVIFLGPGG